MSYVIDDPWDGGEFEYGPVAKARTVKFTPDGKRRYAEPAVIVSTWREHTSIDSRYALGTAEYESDLTLNEIDTEPSGYVSKGIYQIADSEAVSVGMDRADLLALDDATAVMAALAARNLRVILEAWLGTGVPSPADVPSDVYAYMAVAHNAGLHTAVTSIKRYGLDWKAFKERNKDSDWGRRIAEYGDDCIDGGRYWKPEFDG